MLRRDFLKLLANALAFIRPDSVFRWPTKSGLIEEVTTPSRELIEGLLNKSITSAVYTKPKQMSWTQESIALVQMDLGQLIESERTAKTIDLPIKHLGLRLKIAGRWHESGRKDESDRLLREVFEEGSGLQNREDFLWPYLSILIDRDVQRSDFLSTQTIIDLVKSASAHPDPGRKTFYLTRFGAELVRRGQSEQGVSALDDAMTAARIIPSSKLRYQKLGQIAEDFEKLGMHERAKLIVEEILIATADLLDPYDQLNAYEIIWPVYENSEWTGELCPIITEAMKVVQSIEDVRFRDSALSTLSYHLCTLGQLREAMLASRLIQGNLRDRATGLGRIAVQFHEKAEYNTAHELVGEAVQSARMIDDGNRAKPNALRSIAENYASMFDLIEAKRLTMESIDAAQSLSNIEDGTWHLIQSAEFLAKIGDRFAAERILIECAEFSGQQRFVDNLMDVSQYQAKFGFRNTAIEISERILPGTEDIDQLHDMYMRAVWGIQSRSKEQSAL